MRYKAVLFDFDGTLCNTGEGVMKSAAFALDAFHIPRPDDYRDMTFFIGPPLLVTFQEHFGADPAQAEALVQKFRERYTDTGVLESTLYPGIAELLQALRADGLKIGIASSKPEAYIRRLLAHFEIESYFDCVCGVSFTADCESKASIINRCAHALDEKAADILMVGDKKYDIEGAAANHMDSAAVLWGFGTKFEFIEAGAVYYAEKPMDIEAIALGFFEQTEAAQGIYNGTVVTVHCDTVSLTDGSEAKREIVEHPGGVAVAGVTADHEILLVRQFRYAFKEVLYEIPAGKLEPGEDPYAAGVREFSEECGASAANFFPLGEIYPTPGYCSEIIRLYGAKDLTFGRQHLDAGEFLDIVKLPFDAAVEKIMHGEIKDAKTIVAILKLKEMESNGSLF